MKQKEEGKNGNIFTRKKKSEEESKEQGHKNEGKVREKGSMEGFKKGRRKGM